MNNELGVCKGEICNRDGCQGIIKEVDDGQGCSCHINPHVRIVKIIHNIALNVIGII